MLHDTYDGAYTQASIGVAFGDAVLHEISTTPGAGPSVPQTYGDGQLQANWHDVVTITTSQPGPATARITMYFEGGATGSPIDNLNVGYNIGGNVNGGNSLFLYSYGDFGNGQWQGNPAPPTFTYDVGFNSGEAFDLGYVVNTVCYATSSYPTSPGIATASVTAALHTGRFIVLDADNQPVSFTLESKTGSSHGQIIPGGGPYGGFSVTNNAPDRFDSIFGLLDGTASDDTDVIAAFVAPLETKAASDVVDLSGTDGDLQVVQESFDPAAAGLLGPLQYLELVFQPSLGGGFQSHHWESAVLGNYDGPPPTYLGNQHPYNPGTDFHLGYYGVDSANHVAWAVINHTGTDSAARPSAKGAQQQAPRSELFAVGIPFDLVSVVSRKTHGSAGDFDINMPLTGTPSVECRSGGASGNHTLVFTFKSNLAGGEVSVTGGGGAISGTPTMSANTITVNLTSVPNAQRTTLTLHNMKDVANQLLPDTTVTVGFLLGDTTGNGSVVSSDITQTKLQAGHSITSANFRTDLNLNGSINGSDVSLVKSRVGTVLP
jgi:hypothetical protein